MSIVLALVATARADTKPTRSHTVGVAATAALLDQRRGELGLHLGYRTGRPGGAQLGLDLGALRSAESRIGGHAAKDTGGAELRVVGLWPALRRGPLAMALRIAGGLRWLHSGDAGIPEESATLVVLDAGPLAAVALSPRLGLRAAVLLPFAMELRPTSELAEMGGLLRAGIEWRPAAGPALFADVETGPAFGYDGDGTKYVALVRLGCRLASAPGVAPLF